MNLVDHTINCTPNPKVKKGRLKGKQRKFNWSVLGKKNRKDMLRCDNVAY